MPSTIPAHVYEIRPRKDHRGVDLISDAAIRPSAVLESFVGGSGRGEEPSGEVILRLIRDPFDSRVWENLRKLVKKIPRRGRLRLQVP